MCTTARRDFFIPIHIIIPIDSHPLSGQIQNDFLTRSKLACLSVCSIIFVFSVHVAVLYPISNVVQVSTNVCNTLEGLNIVPPFILLYLPIRNYFLIQNHFRNRPKLACPCVYPSFRPYIYLYSTYSSEFYTLYHLWYKFVRMYATLRRSWDRYTFYYTDRFSPFCFLAFPCLFRTTFLLEELNIEKKWKV